MENAQKKRQMKCGFINSRGWNERKWRGLVEECKNLDIVGIAETGWHDTIYAGRKDFGFALEKGRWLID